MSKYLDSFIQSIPAIQGKQIISVLNELRNSGAIKTVEEYRTQMQELTTILSQGKPIPISKLFLGDKGETIDSESFNFMLDRFSDDIDTLLNEISLIADTANAHRAIVRDKLIKDIDLSVKALTVDIRKNEVLANSGLGFSVVQYNDFSNQDELRLARSEGEIAAELFYERRSKTVLGSDYDAAVDVISKTMTLPYEKAENHVITNVDIEYTTNSDAQYFNVDFPEFKLSNVSDNETETYWATSIMADKVVPEGATIELIVTMDGLREVSHVEIDPILYNDFYINYISYIDSNDEQVEISGTSDPILIDESKRVSFSKVTARKIIVGLLQKTYVETVYYTSDASTLYDVKVRDAEIDVTTLSSVLYDQDPNQPIIELLSVPGEAEQVQVSGYAYVIGLDNIRIGNATYTDTGIYVSKPLKVDVPVLMALDTKEEYDYISGSSLLPKGSIEYSIRKQNYDSSDFLIDTETFNILPNTTSIIRKEFLVTDKESREAVLRFRAKTASVLVYFGENQTPLTGRVEGDAPSISDTYEINENGTKITFLHDPANNVVFDVSTIYTISYEPERDIYLNSAATIFMDKNNMIEFTLDRPAFSVARSEIYLVALTRRNVLDSNVTPSVDEYKMLVALKDDTRFANGA